mgnify:FL=1
MKEVKALFFIYNADGGLLNELKYWIDKNLLKKQIACELCDISHGTFFVKFEWQKFVKKLEEEYTVEVLHKDEIPQKIKEKNYAFPCVIAETEEDLVELMDSKSFKDLGESKGVEEFSKEFYAKVSKTL